MRPHLSIRRMAVLLTGLFLSTQVNAESRGLAYVSNQDGAVSIISLDTMQTLKQLDVGAKGPRGIGITQDGKWIVTANKEDGNLSIVITDGSQPPKLVPIGKNPEFVRVMGDKAFVTYEPSSKGGPPPKHVAGEEEEDDDDDEVQVPARVAIVDLLKAKVIQEIIAKPETEGLEFSKDGKHMIVTNESDNSIAVYALATGKLIKNIPVNKYGNRPRGIKSSPDGKTYVVTLEFSDKMLVLNQNYEVIKEIKTGKTPYGVSYNAKGDRIVVASNKDKLLQEFDAKTFAKTREVSVGNRCWHFSYTPDNKDILVACGKSNDIQVVDVQTFKVKKQIADKMMPWGIVTFPKSMGSIDTP